MFYSIFFNTFSSCLPSLLCVCVLSFNANLYGFPPEKGAPAPRDREGKTAFTEGLLITTPRKRQRFSRLCVARDGGECAGGEGVVSPVSLWDYLDVSLIRSSIYYRLKTKEESPIL